MFNGPVQFDMFFLYNDPTIGQNPGTGGQTPAKALPGKEGEVLPLAEAYDQLERDLEKAETEQHVRDGLHQLYQVAWLAKKEAPELAGRFRELALQSASGNYPLFESARHNKTMQHAATLLYAKSYLRDGEYERAAGWLKDTDGTTLQAADRRDWLHIEMDLLRRSGEYEQALGKLEELYAYEQSRGVDIDMLKGDYQPIEQDLAIRMGGDQNVRDRLKQPIVSTSDQELVLENYPNPFNPTTQIRFTLPEQSQVSLVVYDMLGREVVRLVDEVLPAGEQTVRFDASNLANGVYIYRIQAIQQERVRMMTLIK
jgi:tetratricopeptide (TPR) repeat protein